MVHFYHQEDLAPLEQLSSRPNLLQQYELGRSASRWQIQFDIQGFQWNKINKVGQ